MTSRSFCPCLALVLLAAPFLPRLSIQASGGARPQEDRPVSPAPVQITTDGYFKQRPCWHPDGSKLLFARHSMDRILLYELELKTNREKRLTDRESPEYDAVWSPDGKRVACTFVSVSGTQGDLDLYVMNADGSDPTPVARTEGGLSHEEWACWSPDGKRLLFSSTRPGNQEIYVSDADGSNPQRLTNNSAIDAHPAWSPDGGQICFATDRWGGREIAVMNADGSDVRRCTRSPGLDDYPAWSPDGARILFVSNRDGNFEIYVMRPDATQQINLTRREALDTFPAWSPDGARVVFVSNRQGRFDLYVMGLKEVYDVPRQ